MHFERTLRRYQLRNTLPRRVVLQALSRMRKPASPQTLRQWTAAHHTALNIVTIYRVLEAFASAGIIHQQPHTGNVLLCTLSANAGHHGLLSCQRCGDVQEFHNPALCILENRIARKVGFTPKSHVSEMLGTCAACTRSRSI